MNNNNMKENQEQNKKIIKKIKWIKSDTELIFPKLFHLIGKEDFIVKKEDFKEIEKFLSDQEEEGQPIKNLFLLKVKLTFISKLKENEKEEEKTINEINKIKNDIENIIKTNEIFSGLKNAKDKNLEEIILYLIKDIIIGKIKEGKPIEAKGVWTNLGLNLENFGINKRMKLELYQFIRENEKLKEEFKKIDFSIEKPILEQIYECIKISAEYEKGKENAKLLNNKEIKTVKIYGDEERERDEDVKNNHLNQESTNNNLSDELKKKMPPNLMKKLFEQFVININFNKDGEPTFEFKIGKKDSMTGLDGLYEDVAYDKTNLEEKNLIQYLTFWDQVKGYMEQIKDEIKLKTEVILKMTIKNTKQSEESLSRESERAKDICDLFDVNCVSSFEYNKKTFEFLDKNVLVYGIYGKIPGLVFLFNELCNDDYKN